MIGSLGFFELTLFGIIALIVLGPEKLPVAARTLGRWYGNFRRASQRLQSEITSELQLLETQELLKKELDEIRQSEARMKAQMDALQQSLNRTEATLQTSKRQTMDAWQSDSPTHDASHQHNLASSDDKNRQEAHAIATAITLPMTNRWFLLSDYDRRRRLPPAPHLPNYAADPLLNQPNQTL
ncbi:Sec-independent protein translocase protein TatB [Moraxella catarrhalis]|uniref:Twin-arginine translocation protein TatB n=1 Tax=Moraxella catarrhalis TaxID=480 RepID=A0A198UN26_MORCA|nr:Sec-independent protein translocase protein TatB [Moraxella catarrhalis]OAU96224.1 Twin-arginine translocation protein TatB [Moraxella catarrhalis]OAU97756.1 Twin-arginine translocation protein TatB [Moraxella catarrhalis]OAV03994.1 Twin-arginine translocation protein TatB [Moraxella catarrhalis]